MSSTDPFKVRVVAPPARMRVLHRFEKPDGHWAEIRERQVTEWRAIEFLVSVEGSLLESQMFHAGRQVDYPQDLADRIDQFLKNGWIAVSIRSDAH